jgi:RimJ/RimL family protein N-acetyltransferase
LRARPATTSRLRLEPLDVAHAEQMVDVLADPHLYDVIGGEPPDLEQLRSTYQRLLAGPPRPDEAWLNWIVVVDAQPVGYVQATVTVRAGVTTAELAWLTGVTHQGKGYAVEAAAAAMAQLRRAGVEVFIAHIAAGHLPSEGVARRLGLQPTAVVEDGEQLWRRPALT